MSSRTRLWLSVLLTLGLMLQAVPAFGWSNGPNYGKGFGTHDWVLTEGRRLAGNPAWLKASTALAATDDPDMVSRDFYYHVYDVWGSKYGNSPKKIASLYTLAAKAYKAKNYSAASKYVGLLSHYYSDTCQPLHTDQTAAEDKMHSRYEQAVDTRTDKAGENRAWVKSDGFQKVTNITNKTKAAASFSHKYYSSLVSNYSKSGYNSSVGAITRVTLNRAANDLADIIRSMPSAPVVSAPSGGGTGGGGSTSGGTVYITNTGEKFHASGCRYLSKSCIPISRSDAISQGYTPCSVCNP